jgi:hypothetical protein
MTITILENTYSIYQFDVNSELPQWIYQSEFYSVTRTRDEISVVAIQTDVSAGIKCSRDWKILKVEGPLDFSLVGIIAGISNVLKDKGISIFTISTYDTDYILLGGKDLNEGIYALEENGYIIVYNSRS